MITFDALYIRLVSFLGKQNDSCIHFVSDIFISILDINCWDPFHNSIFNFVQQRAHTPHLCLFLLWPSSFSIYTKKRKTGTLNYLASTLIKKYTCFGSYSAFLLYNSLSFQSRFHANFVNISRTLDHFICK